MMRKILTSRKQFSAFSSRVMNSELNYKLQHYESQEPTPNTVQHFMNLSEDRAALYNHLRLEIPVRLARIIPSLPHYFPAEFYQQRTSHFLQDYFEMTFKEIEALPSNIDMINKKLKNFLFYRDFRSREL